MDIIEIVKEELSKLPPIDKAKQLSNLIDKLKYEYSSINAKLETGNVKYFLIDKINPKKIHKNKKKEMIELVNTLEIEEIKKFAEPDVGSYIKEIKFGFNLDEEYFNYQMNLFLSFRPGGFSHSPELEKIIVIDSYKNGTEDEKLKIKKRIDDEINALGLKYMNVDDFIIFIEILIEYFDKDWHG